MILGGIAGAVSVLSVERGLAGQPPEELAWWQTTPELAADLVATVFSALLTSTGVVFSLSMLTLSQTMSQYGPRLLRSFLARNVTQVTLGLLLGTVAYCLVVFRSLGSVESGVIGTPHVSIFLAVVLAMGCLFAIVFFLHQLAMALRAEMVIEGVRRDLSDALGHPFPSLVGDAVGHENRRKSSEDDADSRSDDAPDDSGGAVLSDDDGYLESIDLRSLMRVAEDGGTLIEVAAKPGDYITRLSELAVVAEPSDRLTAHGRRTIREAFRLATRRSPRQDAEAMVFELVEIAVRALSPGVNDPFTAIGCIDNLNAALQEYVRRPRPDDTLRNVDGVARVRVCRRGVGELLVTATRQIVHYGRDDPTILPRIHRLFRDVAAAADRHDREEVREAKETVLGENGGGQPPPAAPTNDPRANDPRANDPRANDPRANDPRANDSRANDSRPIPPLNR